MVQINLNQVQREREKLTEQFVKIRTQIQELDEIKVSLHRAESTREFVEVLTRYQEDLSIQGEGLKNLERVLAEILYSYRQTEEQILEEYEQERLQMPRFSVNRVELNGYRAEDAGIHICF